MIIFDKEWHDLFDLPECWLSSIHLSVITLNLFTICEKRWTKQIHILLLFFSSPGLLAGDLSTWCSVSAAFPSLSTSSEVDKSCWLYMYPIIISPFGLDSVSSIFNPISNLNHLKLSLIFFKSRLWVNS